MRISIVVISYNPVLLHQLERFLAQEEIVEIKAATQKLAWPLLQTLAQADNPVVVWAVRCPLCEDIKLLQTVHMRYPDLKLIVVSPLEADDYETAVLEVGGTAYLTERNLVNALIPTIHGVTQAQGRYVSL